MRIKINDIADIILKTLKIPVPIIDIETLVNELRGQVIRKDNLQINADGKIRRNQNGFIIEIPYTENKCRERFTIAHELGHLFLHMGYLIDEELWNANEDAVYFRKDYGEMEYQAHEFAAAILMPRNKFFSVMKESYIGNGIYNIEYVAKYFNVSVEAAVNRGRWLGILDWR